MFIQDLRRCGRERVGLISDIHADLTSLERALTLLVAEGAQRILCLGDVVEKGPDGDGVVAALDHWLVPVVAGNHCHNALRHAQLPAAMRTDPDLSPQTLARLAQYPLQREYDLAGLHVLAAHGTPDCNATYVFEGDPPRQLKRQLRRRQVDVLLLGHTHRPMKMRYQDTWVCNPGSVCHGRSRDSHTAAILSLPEVSLTVYDLASGRGRRL
jgi:putative phosphoesterase